MLIILSSMCFSQPQRKTVVEIKGDQFYINGKPTYEGRYWKGIKLKDFCSIPEWYRESLMISILKQSDKWAYPDTKKWDPERNTDEFIKNMKKWRKNGLLSFTINMQGGSPQGYSQEQPWHNSGYFDDGSLRDEYMERLERILDRADKLGMVPILGFFYFGQDERLKDEKAVINAVNNMT